MIPKGFVASYGQIAALAGLPSHARYVGRTLHNLPKNTTLPWHRVVNAGLRISLRNGPNNGPNNGGADQQRRRLELEKVEFIGQRIAEAHRWEP
jgi:methylated-DNA-protein-cysteine methyltransferase-like protein